MKSMVCVLLLCAGLASLASGGEVLTPAEAVGVAVDLAGNVGSYGRLYPDAPSVPASWIAGAGEAGEPILVHTYPELRASYYIVSLSSTGPEAATFITLDALNGQWQAYGETQQGVVFPAVSREMATELANEALDSQCSPEELHAVSMPNKSLYWHVRVTVDGEARECFINLVDPGDMHLGVDTELAPEVHPTELQVDEHGELWPRESAPGEPSLDRYPDSYNITDVPHYYQGTNYYAGPTSLQMVMDYWGPHVAQMDIGYVANCREGYGVARPDLRRAGHFSSISTAIQDSTLHGYDERKLGYGSIECQWSYPPDYADRYSDLKNLISSDYPVIIHTWYDATHASPHMRVVKGYSDPLDVFIVHDPWYLPPYSGPDVHFNQAFLVDDLWTRANRWGLMSTPWTSALYPRELVANDTTTVTAVVEYTAPHPFEGEWEVAGPTATLSLPPSLSLAPGETATKILTGLEASGSFGTASWRVVAGSVATGLEASIAARGLVSGSSSSYPAYSDSIGRVSVVMLDVVE
ncbi:C39 family peptidase, partial [bacterium]|nr:C39 family peptidase [bacterium]